MGLRAGVCRVKREGASEGGAGGVSWLGAPSGSSQEVKEWGLGLGGE